VASPKPLLRFKDVAHILDCSPDDVAELARRNKLKGPKQGKFWRFRQEDVVAYKSHKGNDLLTS